MIALNVIAWLAMAAAVGFVIWQQIKQDDRLAAIEQSLDGELAIDVNEKAGGTG
jgi:hypothetical protein